MRRISFYVLFFIKKTKLLKNGEASVCMRITVDGQRVETNIRKSVDLSSWNQAKECVRGKSRKANELSSYIEEAKIKLHSIFTELEEQGSTITARVLQEKFFGLNILKYCCPVNFPTAQESFPKPFRIGLRAFFFKKQAP